MKVVIKTILLLNLVILFSISTGCKYNILVDPKPKIQQLDEKYPLKVGIYIEKTQLDRIYSKDGVCLVGAAHTWNIPVGVALKKSSVNSFQKIFTDVSSIRNLKDFDKNSINIIFNPTVRQFEISQTIKTGFFLKASILDNKNNIIYEKEVRGETKGSDPFLRACLCGVFLAEGAFTNSVNSAFENAFEKLFIDITKTVDFKKFVVK